MRRCVFKHALSYEIIFFFFFTTNGDQRKRKKKILHAKEFLHGFDINQFSEISRLYYKFSFLQ